MTTSATMQHRAEFTVLDGDFYGYEQELEPQELSALARIREYMDTVVRPEVNDHWERAEFPQHLVAGLGELGVLAFPFEETTPFRNSAVFRGFVTMELARVDAGFSTLTGVSSGLVMGTISLLGSEEQKAEWLPKLGSGEAVGAFGLTEPLSGSDAAKGLRTTARREGDKWILNGQKRWIGNATWGDVIIIWARDEADNQVKGFVVPTATPGYKATKIDGKYSQRTVQNADIELTDLSLPDRARLPGANSFRDTARILMRTRIDVAWGAVGTAIGAYETALAYAKERKQFGRPIASYQLMQDLLVKSLSNITACIGMCVRASEMLDRGVQQDHHSAMAKAFVTSRTREVVAWCRELFGGNGIDLDYDIIRYFNDAEALYSFEGTREMNTLIVGRQITGLSAFL
ncbi:acyl-CoA dehydrogenase family protein [Arthrobacter crystallopoietes]|uniref:Glutaryl-CoA dehydrogenase n=1 Tax=Crystallibacter crystallopoietes TaxID=37928 RepID=A0A1H1CUL5_9MICC|nr:acyl-CoA dehydrogenase family protein [Arthrobacter crystallopoietes]SDQ67924.1 glutaryl-CoA dehydrogenase [Arthrobacter crystallopoietes]